MSTVWNEVVTTALLGTDRRPLPTDLLPLDGPGGVAASAVLLEHAVRQRYRFFSYGDAMFVEAKTVDGRL